MLFVVLVVIVSFALTPLQKIILKKIPEAYKENFTRAYGNLKWLIYTTLFLTILKLNYTFSIGDHIQISIRTILILIIILIISSILLKLFQKIVTNKLPEMIK